MNKKYFISACLFILFGDLSASNFGTTGIFDIPTARMQDDGGLKFTISNQKIAKITNITYQPTPWLETTFRYSYGEYYKDRSYSAKVTVLKESDVKPEIAIGIKDILGSGVWGSEYVVASKVIDNFDVTLGLGWGRLADKNSLKNPLTMIASTFDDRAYEVGNGGKLRGASFFKGPRVGVFGGVAYKVPNSNLKLLAEYNSDSYWRELTFLESFEISSLNYGVEWNGLEYFNFKLHRNHGGDVGFSFSSKINTSSLPSKKEIKPYYSSADGYLLSKAPKSLDLDSWYDRLLYDFEKSGLLLRSAKISLQDQRVIIEFSNFRYNLAVDSASRALTLTQIHMPDGINNISFIINESGFKVVTINYSRNNNDNFIKRDFNNGGISKFIEVKDPSNITKVVTPFTNISANLSAKFQLFDPDLPLKHQLYLKIDSLTNISQDWNLIGSFAVDIDNNFDLNRGPDSVLPHVRTEINQYLVNGSSGIESLYLEKKSTISDGFHYRAYLGILEMMYSGIGIEVLYQPFLSRFGFGGTINKVIRRGYQRNFELLDYNTMTGFMSIYYASPFYNFDLGLHIGKYLAKDRGATLEVRRTFDNGFSVGAFATFTNVSAADFGEGSFDKGLYFKIPFDSFSPIDTRKSFSTVIRSLQRDGGQRLEDFTGRLWHDLRSVRYDSLSDNSLRMISK